MSAVLKFALLALLSVATALPALAQREPVPRGYEVIDTVRYDGRDETIVIPVGRAEGRFSVVRLRALDADVRIRSAEIVFGNGSRQQERIRERLDRGEVSDPIDLSGNRRFIREIRLFIRPTIRGREEARIQLLAADERGGPDREEVSRFGPAPRLDRRGRPVGYVLFGSTRVGFRRDTDRIEVGRDRGLFDSIAFTVEDRDILLRSLTIIYGNGQRDRLEIEQRIRQGSVSPAIRLDGDRFIDRIEFDYRAAGRGDGPAVLKVYGAYSERWLNRRPERERDAWLLLGSQRAQMFNRDDDRFEVGRRYGTFKAIRVAARRTDVRVYGLIIRYENGSSEEVPLYSSLNAGQVSQPIDLRGRERFIRDISIRYRSRLSLRGEGVVEVWGLQDGRFAGRGSPADDRDAGRELRDEIRDQLRNLFR